VVPPRQRPVRVLRKGQHGAAVGPEHRHARPERARRAARPRACDGAGGSCSGARGSRVRRRKDPPPRRPLRLTWAVPLRCVGSPSRVCVLRTAGCNLLLALAMRLASGGDRSTGRAHTTRGNYCQATTHALAGLTGAALCVAWSPTRLHEVAAGDSKGNLLLWDTRRAGVLHAFDQLDAPRDAACTGPDAAGHMNTRECAAPVDCACALPPDSAHHRAQTCLPVLWIVRTACMRTHLADDVWRVQECERGAWRPQLAARGGGTCNSTRQRGDWARCDARRGALAECWR
jgi:hypothetical protein